MPKQRRTSPTIPPNCAAAPKPACASGRAIPKSDADTQRLLHELQVHQIELEMQNAELQTSQG